MRSIPQPGIGADNRVMIDEDPTTAPPAPSAADEEVAIGHAVDRLAERFPGVDRERIVELVHEHLDDFSGAPVRDFIPVLVEHDVRRRLTAEAD
jgi:hypothetical protein